MKANFPKGKKEIVVSSFQAFVLLLFNGVGENEKISYETLKEETGLGKLIASMVSWTKLILNQSTPNSYERSNLSPVPNCDHSKSTPKAAM